MRSANNLILCFFLLLSIGGVSFVHSASASKTDDQIQLNINKEVLLTSANEEIRIDAAILLLMREDKLARSTVLEILLRKEDHQSRLAICKAITKGRSAIYDRKDFLEPLIGILVDQEGELAQAAGEALTIFEYSEVGRRLELLMQSPEMEKRIRINAIYAMKLRPDKEAVSELIKLLDDTDPEIAKEAEKALQEAFGYPVGTDKKIWQSILKDLPSKSRVEIMKDRMASQMRQIRLLEQDNEYWRKQYFLVMDDEYEKNDEHGRGALIIKMLSHQEASMKLWALDKISKRSTATALPLEEVKPILLALVSDDNFRVRLHTAKVLTKMGDVNPADVLLDQLRVETYEDVKLAIFDALGEAVYFAFSPGSNLKLDESLRIETLDWARRFLGSEKSKISAKGAEVTRKILELNGVDNEQAVKCLRLLLDRYNQAKKADPVLRGQLLSEMARLCGQGSYREAAVELFKPAFEEGIGLSQSESSQRASLTGLINIEKSDALRQFVSKDLVKPSSISMKRIVIELANEVGSEKDLQWLSELKVTNGDQELVWNAIKAILNRAAADAALQWAKVYENKGNEQYFELYLIAEKKAEAKKNVEILIESRNKLASYYKGINNYEKAVTYYKELLGSVIEPEKRSAMLSGLIELYLNNRQYQPIHALMRQQLSSSDIRHDWPIVLKIEEFFMSGIGQDQKQALYSALEGISVEARPIWEQKISEWRDIIGPVQVNDEDNVSGENADIKQ